ncbi:hypothetical protein BX600DRAFT_526856 [Xylariales sp. PMI_506]|nr:hypothetical protein BX600DRAFT_526856 [Xylariales sp. PMI_506]
MALELNKEIFAAISAKCQISERLDSVMRVDTANGNVGLFAVEMEIGFPPGSRSLPRQSGLTALVSPAKRATSSTRQLAPGSFTTRPAACSQSNCLGNKSIMEDGNSGLRQQSYWSVSIAALSAHMQPAVNAGNKYSVRTNPISIEWINCHCRPRSTTPEWGHTPTPLNGLLQGY